jgi:hypothetical protein
MAYYTTTVKPQMTASKMALGAYTAEDVLFGWTEITLPARGTLKLTNIAIVLRGADGARQEIAMDLIFSTKNTYTFVEHATSRVYPNNDMIGNWYIDLKHYGDAVDYFSVGNTITTNEGLMIPGQSDGKIYVAGMCGVGQTPNFTSTLTVNESNFGAGTQTVITVADKDVRTVFAAGDVIHAADDAVLGTIKSVDSDTQITLTAANTDAIEDDDVLYNINPITLILGFEK